MPNLLRNVLAILMDLDAVAVELHFMQPLRSVRRVLAERRRHGGKNGFLLSTLLSLSALDHAQRRRWRIWRTHRRLEIRKECAAAFGPARGAMPQRTVARKLSQQILEFDLGSVLRAEAREPVAPAPRAVPAAHTDEDERIESEPVARHGGV